MFEKCSLTFLENSSRLSSGTELTEVEQILRYFRRDIYTKKKYDAKFTGYKLSESKRACAAGCYCTYTSRQAAAAAAATPLEGTVSHL